MSQVFRGNNICWPNLRAKRENIQSGLDPTFFGILKIKFFYDFFFKVIQFDLKKGTNKNNF